MDDRTKVTGSVVALVAAALLLVGVFAWETTRLGVLNARLRRVDNLDARLGTLEEKLDTLKEALVPPAEPGATPRDVDRSVKGIENKLDEAVVPGIDDLKGRIVTRSDVDRLAGEMAKVARKVDESSDPALKAVQTELNALRRSVIELKKAVDDSVKKISRKDPEKEIKKLAADIAALKREVPGRDVNAVTRYDLKQLSDKLDKTEGSLRRTSETLRDLERTVENGGAESSRGLADAKRDIRSAKREIDRLEGRVRDVESRTRR